MVNRKSTYLVLLCSIFIVSTLFAEESDPTGQLEPIASVEGTFKTIRNIYIEGNKLVTDEALRARLPFSEGQKFNPAKTSTLISNLYGLHYFNTVTVESEDVGQDLIDLYILVTEKKKVESVTYEGTSSISKEEIEKELHLSEIPTMDEEELYLYADQIKHLYAQKNYHATTVTTEIQPTDRGTFVATFVICEGPKAAVKRVILIGNECVRASILRKLMFTREEWLFGFVNKAGTYQPEMLDVDKYIIEGYYQTHGFLAARVTDIKVDIEPVTQEISVTYYIEEGPQFTVESVSVPGNDLITEEKLLTAVPIVPGDLYSREQVRETMDRLRSIWGRFGYIYADIDPIIIPDFEKKTVTLTFNSELGTIFYLNRVDIIGNTRTRDYVIRRMLTVAEGQLLSIPSMDISKSRIESLGFFDQREGVNWKITKISENEVDLELLLKEIKTGSIGAQITYGGADPQSPSTSIRIGGSIGDKNLFGTGVRAHLSASFSKQDRTVMLNFFQPWLFNRPIGGGLGFQHRSSLYEDFDNVSTTPKEKYTSGDVNVLFFLPGYPDVSTSVAAGIERIHFQQGLRARVIGQDQAALMQTFIDRRFASGTTSFVGVALGQDLRNHPVFPNRGYNWSLSTRVGIPAGDCTFGYVKTDFDATWLTPLIGDYDLIFLLHGHAGIVSSLRERLIPYRDLYNMGGPGTVRGFDFGQIGPQVFGSSVGAKKAFWVNAELIFSITQDQSMRGLVFYDGGAGWDTPLSPTQIALLGEPVNSGALTNNLFRYRHSIGFGLRLLKPAPVRVDVGFKLDRNRRLQEKFYEVHFSMNQEF